MRNKFSSDVKLSQLEPIVLLERLSSKQISTHSNEGNSIAVKYNLRKPVSGKGLFGFTNKRYCSDIAVCCMKRSAAKFVKKSGKTSKSGGTLKGGRNGIEAQLRRKPLRETKNQTEKYTPAKSLYYRPPLRKKPFKCLVCDELFEQCTCLALHKLKNAHNEDVMHGDLMIDVDDTLDQDEVNEDLCVDVDDTLGLLDSGQDLFNEDLLNYAVDTLVHQNSEQNLRDKNPLVDLNGSLCLQNLGLNIMKEISQVNTDDARGTHKLKLSSICDKKQGFGKNSLSDDPLIAEDDTVGQQNLELEPANVAQDDEDVTENQWNLRLDPLDEDLLVDVNGTLGLLNSSRDLGNAISQVNGDESEEQMTLNKNQGDLGQNLVSDGLWTAEDDTGNQQNLGNEELLVDAFFDLQDSLHHPTVNELIASGQDSRVDQNLGQNPVVDALVDEDGTENQWNLRLDPVDEDQLVDVDDKLKHQNSRLNLAEVKNLDAHNVDQNTDALADAVNFLNSTTDAVNGNVRSVDRLDGNPPVDVAPHGLQLSKPTSALGMIGNRLAYVEAESAAATETQSSQEKTNLPNRFGYCPACPAKFSRLWYLDLHLLLLHYSNVGITSVSCPECSSSFENEKQLRAHVSKRHPADLVAMNSQLSISLGMVTCALTGELRSQKETKMKSSSKIPGLKRSFPAKGSHRRVHLAVLVEELCRTLRERKDLGDSLTTVDVKQLAIEICSLFHLKPFIRGHAPSQAWASRMWRSLGFGEERTINDDMNSFYTGPTKKLISCGLKESNIFYVCETAFCSFTSDGVVNTSATIGGQNLLSLILTSNASGFLLEPTVVFQGEIINIKDLGANFLASSNNYECKDLLEYDYFQEWFQKFVQQIPPDRPVLLLVEGHIKQMPYKLMLSSRVNNVHIVFLPRRKQFVHPHSQIRDNIIESVTFKFIAEAEKFLTEREDGLIRVSDFAQIFEPAWKAARDETNFTETFKEAGFLPLLSDNTLNTASEPPTIVPTTSVLPGSMDIFQTVSDFNTPEESETTSSTISVFSGSTPTLPPVSASETFEEPTALTSTTSALSDSIHTSPTFSASQTFEEPQITIFANTALTDSRNTSSSLAVDRSPPPFLSKAVYKKSDREKKSKCSVSHSSLKFKKKKCKEERKRSTEGIIEPDLFMCQHCGQCFVTDYDLKSHVKRHRTVPLLATPAWSPPLTKLKSPHQRRADPDCRVLSTKQITPHSSPRGSSPTQTDSASQTLGAFSVNLWSSEIALFPENPPPHVPPPPLPEHDYLGQGD